VDDLGKAGVMNRTQSVERAVVLDWRHSGSVVASRMCPVGTRSQSQAELDKADSDVDAVYRCVQQVRPEQIGELIPENVGVYHDRAVCAGPWRS